MLEISSRLHELNEVVANLTVEGVTFDDALRLASFYRDFNDTNALISEAEKLASSDMAKLHSLAVSFLSEADKFLSQNLSRLDDVDFKNIFNSHIASYENRYNEAAAISTELWRKYSSLSNRLDFLLMDSDEYKSLEIECDRAKVEYEDAHSMTDRLYDQWQREIDRCFCVGCFKPLFLIVLVERLKAISQSIIADINRKTDIEL